MEITLEYLRDLSNQMAESKVKPLLVYIAIIGDKKFMCPVTSLPEGLAPLPYEIVETKFPVESHTVIIDGENASPVCNFELCADASEKIILKKYQHHGGLGWCEGMKEIGDEGIDVCAGEVWGKYEDIKSVESPPDSPQQAQARIENEGSHNRRCSKFGGL